MYFEALRERILEKKLLEALKYHIIQSSVHLSSCNYRSITRKIVLVATQDEAYHNGGPVLGALPRIGMKLPITFGYRGSLALIGYAGSYKPSWITQAHALRGLGPSTVTASIAPGRVFFFLCRLGTKSYSNLTAIL